MNTKNNYFIEVIRAAVANGLEFDPEDSIMDVYCKADDYLITKPIGRQFVRNELRGSGMDQCYTFYDEATGYSNHVSGDIFDFRWQYRAKDERLFHEEKPGEFKPVDWFDVPMPGEPHRDEYIFVFDIQVLSNGELAYLYDYLM
jgi:hypothetical protein